MHGATGSLRLSDGRVEGDDPLRDFGPHAAGHLRRMDGFGNCPDLLINGRFDPERGDVAPFEEFAGSHGGMGGAQMHPFLLHPGDLEAGDTPLVGAASVNALLLAWRARLAEGPASTG